MTLPVGEKTLNDSTFSLETMEARILSCAERKELPTQNCIFS